MKNRLQKLLRITVCASMVFPIVACTAGKLDPVKALTTMHIVQSDDYKKREGWSAVEKLSQNDCAAYKSGGGSLLQWKDKTCDAHGLIEAVNEKREIIPLFYAAYHEYGSYEVGTLSSFDNGAQSNEDAMRIMANLAKVLSNSTAVDSIFIDYENDRRSMGLKQIDERDFKKTLSEFALNRDRLASSYQKVHDENQKQYQEERETRVKREKEESIASEREINLALWQNPTPEQQMIIDAFHTVKFTIRNDGVAYANGRRFMSMAGLESLKNSLNMSMDSCSDVGAYVGEKVLSRSCVQGMAGSIIEWGNTAKDKTISDRAWNAAAMDSSINYNPIKYEIIFSHWAGMARVYASRGY